jgi:hypothetical protein
VRAGLEERITTLQYENTGLREQAAALKADKPSGMERSTEANLGPKKKQRSRRRCGATLPLIKITKEVVLPAHAPSEPRFKGYDDNIAQDLNLRARAARYRRER